MVEIKKDAPKLGDIMFYDWLLGSNDFNSGDFIKSKVVRSIIEEAIQTIRAFEVDLRRAGIFDEEE